MDNRVEADSGRLSKNFHKTFIPERRFLQALLEFAAAEGKGTIQEISRATGIPTGESSGKVAPTLDYCRAMGLVSLPEARTSRKQPQLTAFGRAVFLNDAFFLNEMTQWLAHLNLCSRKGGAEMWFRVFWEGAVRLGPSFTREGLLESVSFWTGTANWRVVAPLVRMYQEDASFSKCGALREETKTLSRRKMPVSPDFVSGYACWILAAMESIPDYSGQVTIDQLEDACGLSQLTGWTQAEVEEMLNLLSRWGALSVDRHMRPWILRGNISSSEAWKRLYEN